MSAVTVQPLPFGRLERERHIEALFHAFRKTPGPSSDRRDSAVFPGLQGAGPGREEGEVMEKEAKDGVGPCGNGNRRRHGYGAEGLTLLNNISQIRITARPELQGPRCVPRRTYSIATGTSEQLYVAVEESSCLCLHCCGPARSCSLRAFDRQAHQVFLLNRPPRMDACCLGCCLMEMQAFDGDGQLAGAVYQRWSMFTPLFEVCDSDGTFVARVQGSCCPCRCYANQEFQVVSMLGETLGRIWKKWPGFNKEYNMDHEYFGLDVLQDMSPRNKLLLLAATFLLNHMFFEMS
ncbi:phospholipid scramblase family member 5 [Brienomyrus brachyistius]|uniref:phospholipid scramblase family member 5 n=1 Tax=Brienomyrus brachyistius TaxID=42636 RepID=UPI0020B383FB|nr:phospholipid scramblase family member 5 [Brienomyrus brachyistius]